MVTKLKQWLSKWIERGLLTLLPLSKEQFKEGSFGVTMGEEGVSFNHLPVVVPAVGTVHQVAKDLKEFLVTDSDSRLGYVILCEVGSDVQYDIDAALFELLFQPSETVLNSDEAT